MAFLMPPQSAQAPLDPQAHWITPEELESTNEFERVVKLYGEEQDPENENPLQF